MLFGSRETDSKGHLKAVEKSASLSPISMRLLEAALFKNIGQVINFTSTKWNIL